MDPDGQESSALYKQLIEEKCEGLKGKDNQEEQPDSKDKRKLEISILQVSNTTILN